MRMTFIRGTASLLTLVCALTTFAAEDVATPGVDVLKDAYPRAYFFRLSEKLAASGEYSYTEWDRQFRRLGGIAGKVLDEEVVGRSVRNIDYFTRFKQEHPEQLVLLHYNGNACDPRDAGDAFDAGHWLYYVGTPIQSDLLAKAGETDLHVQDATRFRTGIGRYHDRNEDIGLCALDSQGKPDWSHSEQVQLLSVNVEQNTIRVRRGAYGTSPRRFEAGHAWAASHLHEGPWTEESNPMWYYNLSTACPQNSQGETCGEVLANRIRDYFAPEGPLRLFDGIELDATVNDCRDVYPVGDRGIDTNCDGLADAGWLNGVNQYGIGQVEFLRDLRTKLPAEKLLLADGGMPKTQRAFGVIDGVEFEGWPIHYDVNFKDWSGAWNRLRFWSQHSQTPACNYINHRWGPKVRPAPLATQRLVIAVSTLASYALSSHDQPGASAQDLSEVWDELVGGQLQSKYWLGKPLGPARRLAKESPDLLRGVGKTSVKEFLDRWSSDTSTLSLDEDAIRARADLPLAGKDYPLQQILLQGIDWPGGDLTLFCKVKASSMARYPKEYARQIRIHVVGQEEGVAKNVSRGTMTWAGSEWFEATFYFRDVQAGPIDFAFEAEGGEPICLQDLTLHASTDAVCREFEHGVVLANPDRQPYAFPLDTLFPEVRLQRLNGSSRQDPHVNHGSLVGPVVLVPPGDGLFLSKTHHFNGN